MSNRRSTIEHVFEQQVIVDLNADESALVELIAELEHLKSAAAAAQAR
jgi:hypothetical protein